MPQPRFKAPEDHPLAYYHCVSRVVNRDFRFGAAERDRFLKYAQVYSSFTGVRVLSFCILSNHFHLLLEVPKRPDSVTDQDLLRAVAFLYPPLRVEEVRKRLEALRSAGHSEQAEQLRESYMKRMWDVSFFMKELKQRFTKWYNHQEERRGTLWEERFRSVLVQSGESLALVAMYIDMNPVRAGITSNPASFEWSAYGRAVAGDEFALMGLDRLMALVTQSEGSAPSDQAAATATQNLSPDTAVSWYGELIEGRIPMNAAGEDSPVKPSVFSRTKDEICYALHRKQPLAWSEIGQVRSRYFTDGGFLGHPPFVEELFTKHRERFGPRRIDGSRPLRGTSLDRFAVLRDLQKDVVQGMNARDLAKPKRSHRVG